MDALVKQYDIAVPSEGINLYGGAPAEIDLSSYITPLLSDLKRYYVLLVGELSGNVFNCVIPLQMNNKGNQVPIQSIHEDVNSTLGEPHHDMVYNTGVLRYSWNGATSKVSVAAYGCARLVQSLDTFQFTKTDPSTIRVFSVTLFKF